MNIQEATGCKKPEKCHEFARYVKKINTYSHNFTDQFWKIWGCKCFSQTTHFSKNTTQSPNIALIVIFFTFTLITKKYIILKSEIWVYHFRTKIIRSSQNCLCMHFCVHDFRNSKISNFNYTPFIQKYVGGLQISVIWTYKFLWPKCE